MSAPEETILLPQVKTQKLLKTSLEKAITLSGELLPIKAINLKSKIPGRIEKIILVDGKEASENTKVEKGDILVFLENKESSVKLDYAKASYQIALSSLKLAEIHFLSRLQNVMF